MRYLCLWSEFNDWMETKIYSELKKQFTGYLIEKKLRRTEERYTILKQICTYSNHFDIGTLHEKLEDENFHVSKATLYNTLDIFTEAGLIVRHQINPQCVQYELRMLADTHQHLICTKCGMVREIRNQTLKAEIKNLKITRFTTEFSCLYIYGICSKCTFRLRQEKKKSINKTLDKK